MDRLDPVDFTDANAARGATRSAALADYRRLKSNREAIAGTVMASDIPLLQWLDQELVRAWTTFLDAGGSLADYYRAER